MPSTPPFSVLSVDDDLDACEMMSLLLRSQGIDLICAQSASEAWTKIDAQCFDLYLLDAWLPTVDGFELCRQIRARDTKTPILFYSGAAYDTDKQKGIAAGANGYITKPNVDTLVRTMLSLTSRFSADTGSAHGSSHQSQPAQNWFSPQFFSVKAAGN